MGGRRGRGGLRGPLTQPHRAGLEGGARVVSLLAGMLLISAGLLHISAAGDHTNLPVMMAGFLVVATLQAALGGLLLFRRAGALVLAGGLALTLGAVATWLVSRTAGLPFLPGGHMEPIGFKDGVTVLFEIGTLPLLAILVSAELDRVRLPSQRLGSQAVAFAGAAMFALFVPALVLGGGEHHSAGELAHAHGDETAHAHEDGDGHHGEQLAQAGGGAHAHGEGAQPGHAGGDPGHGAAAHTAAGHAHGQRATPEFFSDLQSDGAHGHGGSGHAPETGGHHDRGSGGGGGHGHGGGGNRGGGHGHGGGRHGDGGHQQDGGHGDGGHGDGHGGGDHPEGTPAGNERALALESGDSGEDGRPARGPALVFYDQPNEELNGPGHGHQPCEPTAAQQAAADQIVTEVKAELEPYANNPAAAIADGFNYVFGPTDRMLHMVHLQRVSDPDVLKAPEIESFIYYMTDTGFVPIGGMFVMPEYGMEGPQPGGCLTQWHHHGGFVGRWATAGTSDNTPPMMHVFTYPGLDPWGHYNGRDLAPLWTPGRWVPSVCRSADDANSGCLP